MEKSKLRPMENINEIPSIEQIESRESKDLESNQEKASTSDLTPHATVGHPPMTFKRGMALISLTLLFVTSVAPNFFISGSLSYIVDDIGGHSSIAWIAMSSSLAMAAICPFAGTISDLLGRRHVALLGALLVIVGVMITGLAQRVEVAIGGMAVVGVGGGLAEVVAGAAVAEMAPVKSRGKYMGTAFLVILPFGASSTYAQLYSSTSTWRWGAWISVILVGINFIMVWIFYNPPPRVNSQGLSKREILRRVDYIGGLLSTCGFAIFLLGLQWGGYTYPWISVPVLTTLILGLLLIISFISWELSTEYPMFPRSLFVNKRVTIVILFVASISGVNFHSLVAIWPLECQILFGPDPLQICRIVSAAGFSIIVGIIVVNCALSKFRGAARELIAISCALMTAGTGSMSLVTQHTPNLAIGLSILACLGIGGLLQPTGTILTIVTPDELLATIIAASITIRVIGGSIGYAVYFNILQNKLSADLRANVIAASLKAGLALSQLAPFAEALLSQNSTALGRFPQAIVFAATEAVRDSYYEGFRLIYLVSIGFGIAALVVSLFLGDIRKYMNDRVAVDIH